MIVGARLRSSPTARSRASEGPNTSPRPTARRRQPKSFSRRLASSSVVRELFRRRVELLAVVLDGDLAVLPAQVEPVDDVPGHVDDLDLRRRPGESGIDDPQPQA